MAGTRAILSAVSIILLAGGIVLDFFIVLSGAVNSSPVNKVYFLQAATNGVTSSHKSSIPNPARWTYFALCGAAGGKNSNCGPVHAAFPFDPTGKENFDTTQGLPHSFTAHPNTYYYLSRVAWAFFIIALFWAVIGLLMSLAAMFARLGAYLTGLTVALAMGSQALAAALMTAWTVLAKDAFKKNGQKAELGEYAYGFTWAAFVCFLISTVLFCAGGGADKSKSSSSGGKSKGGYFGRKRSTKSRGSFVDSESGRRVKDEYD